MQLTQQLITDTLALEDGDQKVQAYARLMRLASEDLIEHFDQLEVDLQDDDSAVIYLPSGVRLVLAPMEDDDYAYTCGIYHDPTGTIIHGGFTLLDESHADKLDSIFI